MWEGWKGCTRSPPGCGRPPPVLTGCVRASHAFHTRRRHSGVACGKGGKGVRAPIHLPHQAHRTRSARGRAFHASHRTPPRFLPHSGPQTRGTTPPAAGRRRRKPKPAANPPGLRHRRITDVPCLTPLHSHGESTGRAGQHRGQRPRNSHRQPRKSAGTAWNAGVHTGIARERETRTDGAASSPVRVPPAPIPDGATTYRFPLPGAADAASGTPAWRPAGQGPSHREQVPEDGEPHRHRDAQRAPYEP